MSTKSRKSTQVRPSSTRQKARVAVQRVALSDTRRLPKPRVGFENLVEPLAAIVAKYGAELGTGGIDVALMRSSLSAYQGLAEEYQAAVDELASVESTRLVHASTAWMQFLVIYDRARSVARTNAALRGDIEPIEQFMKTGPHKAHAAVPPVTTTTTATTP